MRSFPRTGKTQRTGGINQRRAREFLGRALDSQYCCRVGEGQVKDAPCGGMGPVLGVTRSGHHIVMYAESGL